MSFRRRIAGGLIVQSPCADSEDRRHFLAIQQANTGSGIPVGAVVFWGLSIASLPDGCVLADGVANALKAGGSGIRCIDSFLHTTRSNGTLGNIMEADTIPSGGAHTHSFRTTPAEPLVTVGLSYTDIKAENGDEHPHTVEISGGSHYHAGGGHHHTVSLLKDTVDNWTEGGQHEHDINLVDDVILAAHSSADVVACFEDHATHVHSVVPNIGPVDEGSGYTLMAEEAGAIVIGSGTILHREGVSLTHDPHGHPVSKSAEDGAHTHQGNNAGHEHYEKTSDGDADGFHKHGGGTHRHDLVIEKDGKHPHDMDDPGHEHDASASAHQHGGQLYGGSHTHEAGTPYQVQMVPIERIY